MSLTVSESMSFKDGTQKFYKDSHKELIALVAAAELIEYPNPAFGEFREVRLSAVQFGHEVRRRAVPEMQVEAFTPEEIGPNTLSFLKVLGVKLDPKAGKWLRASMVYPHKEEIAVKIEVDNPYSGTGSSTEKIRQFATRLVVRPSLDNHVNL